MFRSIKNKLSRTTSGNNNNKQQQADANDNSSNGEGDSKKQADHVIAKPRARKTSSSALKRIQQGMGNLASSLQRHHAVDVKREHARHLMTSLDRMRRGEGDGDVVISSGGARCHACVLEFSPVLYQLCKEKEEELKKDKPAEEDEEEKKEEVTEENNDDERQEKEEEVKEDTDCDAGAEEDLIQLENEEKVETSEEAKDDETEQSTQEEDTTAQEDQEKTEDDSEKKAEESAGKTEDLVEQTDDSVKDTEDSIEKTEDPIESTKDSAEETENPEAEAESSTEKAEEPAVGPEEPSEAAEEPESGITDEHPSGDKETEGEEKREEAIPDEGEEVEQDTVTVKEDEVEEMKDDEDDVLISLVDFLYTATIQITASNADKLARLATSCGLEGVAGACHRYIASRPTDGGDDDVEAAAEAAETYEDDQLHTRLLDHFARIRLAGLHVDAHVTLKRNADDDKFSAHGALLRAAFGGGADKLEGSEPGALGKVLGFLYTGHLRAPLAGLCDVTRAAGRLGCGWLVEACGEALSATIGNDSCFPLRQLALDSAASGLQEACESWIHHHFNAVAKTSAFKQLQDVEAVAAILESDRLNLDFPLADGEMSVFGAAARWLYHDLDGRRKHTERIFSCVRLPLIGLERLVETVTTDQAVLACDATAARVADVMLAKKSQLHEPCPMRGTPCVVTTGGSAIVEDVTSENQDYTPVGYYHKVTMYECETGRHHDWCALPESRSLHCAVVCQDLLLVLGGYDPFSCISNEVFCLDLAAGKWSRKPSMKNKRVLFTAHVVDDVIYVTGGLSARGYLSSVEKLDTRSMTWSKSESLPLPIYRHAGCTMGGELYVSGGNEKSKLFYSFDCSAGAGWKQQSSMLIGRDSHVMCAVGKDTIVCAGGEGINFTVERFSSGDWELLELPADRRISPTDQLFLPGHACPAPDQMVILGGWVGENEPSDQIWSLKVSENKWTRHSYRMPIALGSAASCVVTLPESYWKTRLAHQKDIN